MIVPNGVKDIAACMHHSLFIKEDGSLWALGMDGNGKLGAGRTSTQWSPTMIVDLGRDPDCRRP